MRVVILWMLIGAALWQPAEAQQVGDPDCESILLVSSWFNNNVKLYDGCSGNYIRDLDSSGTLRGPQAIVELDSGDILVVSENNHRLVVFDRNTLSEPTVVLDNTDNGFVPQPVGAVLDAQNTLYVASFSQNSLVRVDTTTWQVSDTLLPASTTFLNGADAGIFLANNQLYVPGYNSDNVISVDVTNGQVNRLIPNGGNGLDAARGVLVKGNLLYVTSERSNAVLVFNAQSGEFRETLTNLFRPAGITQDGDAHALVTTRNAVHRVQLATGQSTTLVSESAGGLNGANYVIRLTKQNGDTDGDGLSDIDETSLHGTDPLLSDTDADGMPDGFEVEHGLQATVNDSAGDADADGLSNLQEYEMGTLPDNADTDADGLPDGSDANPLVIDTTPVIRGTPTSSVAQGESYSFTPQLDYPGDVSHVTFEITNKPSWLDFDASNGALTGVAGNSDVGTHSDMVITSSNGQHSDTIGPFSVEVINVNDPPSQSREFSAADTRVVVDQAFTLQLSRFFTDVDPEDTLTFSANGATDPFELNEEGALTGTPTSTGTVTISFTVTDVAGASVDGQVTVTVTEPPAAQTPQPQGNDNSGGGGSSGWLLLLLFATGLYRLRRLYLS